MVTSLKCHRLSFEQISGLISASVRLQSSLYRKQEENFQILWWSLDQVSCTQRVWRGHWSISGIEIICSIKIEVRLPSRVTELFPLHVHGNDPGWSLGWDVGQEPSLLFCSCASPGEGGSLPRAGTIIGSLPSLIVLHKDLLQLPGFCHVFHAGYFPATFCCCNESKHHSL